MRQKYFECKGPLHHSWYLIDVERKSSFGTPVHYMCERCGTKKKEIYDIHGELASRYYEYPEGYKDEFRIPIQTHRLNLIYAYRKAQKKNV